MIYNLYIFNPVGQCLYYGEWERTRETDMSQDEEFKLVYGMLYSLKSFVSRISPATSDSFQSYQTNNYKLSMYETPSGCKFVINTSVEWSSQAINEILHALYKEVYVEFAVKNPLLSLQDSIDSELFKSKIETFINSRIREM
ncbi:hypothetical protein ACHWQZ_G013301 [Mnemiopsis leidyi]